MTQSRYLQVAACPPLASAGPSALLLSSSSPYSPGALWHIYGT